MRRPWLLIVLVLCLLTHRTLSEASAVSAEQAAEPAGTQKEAQQHHYGTGLSPANGGRAEQRRHRRAPNLEDKSAIAIAIAIGRAPKKTTTKKRSSTRTRTRTKSKTRTRTRTRSTTTTPRRTTTRAADLARSTTTNSRTATATGTATQTKRTTSLTTSPSATRTRTSSTNTKTLSSTSKSATTTAKLTTSTTASATATSSTTRTHTATTLTTESQSRTATQTKTTTIPVYKVSGYAFWSHDGGTAWGGRIIARDITNSSNRVEFAIEGTQATATGYFALWLTEGVYDIRASLTSSTDSLRDGLMSVYGFPTGKTVNVTNTSSSDNIDLGNITVPTSRWTFTVKDYLGNAAPAGISLYALAEQSCCSDVDRISAETDGNGQLSLVVHGNANWTYFAWTGKLWMADTYSFTPVVCSSPTTETTVNMGRAYALSGKVYFTGGSELAADSRITAVDEAQNTVEYIVQSNGSYVLYLDPTKTWSLYGAISSSNNDYVNGLYTPLGVQLNSSLHVGSWTTDVSKDITINSRWWSGTIKDRNGNPANYVQLKATADLSSVDYQSVQVITNSSGGFSVRVHPAEMYNVQLTDLLGARFALTDLANVNLTSGDVTGVVYTISSV